ncbi:MAG TPA: molecular chaperone TorD family protein [Aggregatilinea sp.]|uniref:TorD/DmsD family molecular chaperone n=1 Tax=Aggregatilinea sp. TaxID=2806333 RepID=UPI002D025201|nr:molecular chaperone TorD family protein [Aggregatilinea sp.]HML20310.1 molecular chaperone TorD family protein [Aggregatilinea sp.]
MMTLADDAATAAFSKLAELAQHRSDLYRLLAIGFSNPTSDLIFDLQIGTLVEDLRQSLSALALSEAQYTASLNGLVELSSRCRDDDPAAVLSQLRVEYMRLFNNPRVPLIPIYETLYREEATATSQPLLIASPTAMVVDRCYRDAGLHMVSKNSPDHLTIELEFLVYLCGKESEAWDAGNNAMAKKWRRTEQTFLDEHLGTWGVTLFCRVQELTEERFYRCFAALAATFLRLETGAYQPR